MILFLRAVALLVATAVSVLVFTGSSWKASWISITVFLLALSTTWRRYLELLCISTFAVAVVVACVDTDTLEKMKLVFLHLVGASAADS
jgi:hypothetical protein